MRLTRYLAQTGQASMMRAATLLFVAGTAGLVSGCSETVRTGQASSYLVLQRLEGASGAESGSPFQSVLRSDVQTKGSIFEDNGRVALSIAMKDVTNPTGPSANNVITLNRYRVEYRRTVPERAPVGRADQGHDLRGQRPRRAVDCHEGRHQSDGAVGEQRDHAQSLPGRVPAY